MFTFDETKLNLSGERFSIVYKITESEQTARVKAQEICIEQTVDIPSKLIPRALLDTIVGRLESFEPLGGDSFKAVISYAVELAANEFTQLINMIFGNISLKPGVRVMEIILPESLLKHFQGPRFGRDGLRKLLKVKERPIMAASLKPMGLSAEELAELTYKLAYGGIDIILDHQSLSNQSFSPFERRVKLCAQAARRANKETGNNCIYVPNITTNFLEVRKKGDLAKALGAGGLLLTPGLVGFDAMKVIAEDDQISIPVFTHPTFQGSYVLTNNGISHYVLFGQLTRLAGADATIYPNFSGSLAFSKEEGLSIARGTNAPMGSIKANIPCPAGGINSESIPQALQTYGNDVIFLIGEELYDHGNDLIENCRYFRKLVERH